MKNALLGATSSGKTVYFSSLYHAYSEKIAFDYPTAKEREAYRQQGIPLLHGMRFSLADTPNPSDKEKLAASLRVAAKLLDQYPMQWPEKTDNLNRASLNVQFDFFPVNASEEASYAHSDGSEKLRAYPRSIELYDPAGGALYGEHKDSASINSALATCDAGIVFLSAKHLLEVANAKDDDALARVKSYIAIKKMLDIVKKMHVRAGANDIFPICFVVSQSDRIQSPDPVKTQENMALVNEVLYDRMLIPLSKENRNFMICVCPTSVVDAETGRFKPKNLEWPFLFSTMGTIFRNSIAIRKLAQSYQQSGTKAKLEAERLEKLYKNNSWGYFLNWVKTMGDSFGAKKSLSELLVTEAGRKMKISDDDGALARNILAVYARESRKGLLYSLMAGKELRVEDDIAMLEKRLQYAS